MEPTSPVPSGGSTQTAGPSTVACIVCKEEIKAGAQKCIHCDSFQDWRASLTVSSSVLALLVALVSVIGVTAPVLHSVLVKPNSRVLFAFEKAQLQSVFVVASNPGDRPGSLGTAEIKVESEQTKEIRVVKLFSYSERPHVVTEVVAPGESKEFQLVPTKQYEGPFLSSGLAVLGIPGPYHCEVTIDALQFDGSVKKFGFARNCAEFSKVIEYAASPFNNFGTNY